MLILLENDNAIDYSKILYFNYEEDEEEGFFNMYAHYEKSNSLQSECIIKKIIKEEYICILSRLSTEHKELFIPKKYIEEIRKNTFSRQIAIYYMVGKRGYIKDFLENYVFKDTNIKQWMKFNDKVLFEYLDEKYSDEVAYKELKNIYCALHQINEDGFIELEKGYI